MPPVATRWQELYLWAAEQLRSPMEARWIFEEASGANYPVGLEEPAGTRAAGHLRRMVQRRLAGEPLQYVLGSWGFRTLSLMVDRRVLIPRPETEQVVELALAEYDRLELGRPGGRRPPDSPVLVDLGTGSGAIALSLAAERSSGTIWATDRSADALAVAGANLAGLAGAAGTRVRLVHGTWWSALPGDLRGCVSLAVSNPPYLAEGELVGLDPVVRDWEPAEALVAGPGGLEDVAGIIASAPEWLSRPAALVLEIAPHQADEASALARRVGFDEVAVHPDLAGRDRVLVARRDRPGR